MNEKVPAQLPEIEQSVLAACLLFPEMRTEALELLSASDFYRPDNAEIFKTVADLAKRREPVDLLTVAAALTGKIDGIAARLAEITEMPVPSDMTSYCRKISNCRQLREAQGVLFKAYSQCYHPAADFAGLIDEVTGKLSEIDEGTRGAVSFLSMAELTQRSAERYAGLKGGNSLPGISTGFKTLDRLTGGFRGPQLIIIAGRPGTGKTTFAQNMLANIAESGICCGFFSLEMGADEIDDRWNAAAAGINGSILRFGRRFDDNTWARLLDAFEKKSRWPLLIDDTPATIAELKRRARLMKRAGARILFIDQLSHIRPDRADRGKSAWEVNSHHVEQLAFLKKELKIPVVLLAQLNRELEKRANQKPMLADLKNTGSLEEHADIVLLGYRPYLHTHKPEDEPKAQWEIAKHRGGPTWTIPMRFDGRQTRFYELAE
mgnify:CR=1 FL=1